MTWADAPLLAIAIPGGALALASLVLLVAAAVHQGPLWSDRPINVSEAAAMRDRATMIRLIDEGSDPTKAYPVPPGIVSARLRYLTPLEAAIAARRSEVVDLLLWRMEVREDSVLARAWCLARHIRAADVVRAVERYRVAA
ncbi:MAG TPA: hypothetical protein VIX63_11080, partial [Vicinamibacterales bacterium]